MKKKEKPVRLLSRRQLAVRRVLIAAATYLVITSLTGIGVLFPRHAIYIAEQLEGIGWTSVIKRDWMPEFHRNVLVYLTGNENATMLSGTFLTPLGWMDYRGRALDCSKGQPVYCEFWMDGNKEKEHMLYVFGRVDDPEIVRIEFLAQYEASYELGVPGPYMQTEFTLESERSEWIEKHGRTYFLIKDYPSQWPYEFSMSPLLIAYDKEGNEVGQVDMDYNSWAIHWD